MAEAKLEFRLKRLSVDSRNRLVDSESQEIKVEVVGRPQIVHVSDYALYRMHGGYNEISNSAPLGAQAFLTGEEEPSKEGWGDKIWALPVQYFKVL